MTPPASGRRDVSDQNDRAVIGGNGGPLSDGWIARHRSVRDHWLVGHGIHVKPADPERKRCHTQGEAWEDMLMECRYADGFISNGGKKMELRRGEMVGAVSWLAHRWNWTPKVVRRFLDQLENDGMISLKNPASEKGNQIGRQANVVTVCNYDAYQSGYEPEGQSKGQPQGDQRATTGRPEGDIYKEEQRNKGTKEKEENPSDLSPSGDDAGKKPTIRIRDVAREAFAEWQEFAKIHGLPVPRNTSFEAFAPNIAARLQENADELTLDAMLRVWRIALACVAKSRHCRGENDRGWRADLDFVSNRKSFAKIMAGNYGNGAVPLDDRWRIAVPWATAPPTPPQQPAKSRDGAFRQAIEEWAREGETQ